MVLSFLWRTSVSAYSLTRVLTDDREKRVSQSSTQIYIAAYFEYFHPSLPLLHRPTITKGLNEGYPEALKTIIIAIGSLYTAKTLSGEDATSSMRWSQSLWESGCKELNRLVCSLYCRKFAFALTGL